MKILSKRTYANVMSTVAVFIALGGGAVAASRFVGTNGAVSLCVSSNGSVKVLAQKKRCANHTQRISVNTQGLAGPRGPAGATGVPGPQGAPGVQGTPGEATGYSAGPGLTISGSVLSADFGAVQARIAGSGCASDEALQSVAQTGSPSCTGLHAYSATAGNLSEADAAIPPGRWVLLGEITGKSSSAVTLYCQIDVSGAAVATAGQYAPAMQDGSVSLEATVTTTTKPATPIATSCNTDGGDFASWSDGTIIAIPVAALN